MPIRLPSFRTWAVVVVLAGLMVLLAFEITSSRPAFSGPVSGPTRPGPNSGAGVDLQCGNGQECGPDNPAVRVAPTLPIGPKIQP